MPETPDPQVDLARPEPAHIKQDIHNYLKFLRKAGFLYLVPNLEAPHASAHSRSECLEALRVECAKCTRCTLSEGRTHVVFGEGDPNADIMFVGEAPGAEEDRQGRPFIGRSGKLLTSMMEEVGFKREEVFIANIIKCRPPDNRNPKVGEIECCEPYLMGQVDLIKPKVIISLGLFASQCLTRTKTPLYEMRGQFFLYHNVKLMPTLHPAAVLRNMNLHADVIGDLRRAYEAAHVEDSESSS